MTGDKVIAKIIWLTFLAHPVDTHTNRSSATAGFCYRQM